MEYVFCETRTNTTKFSRQTDKCQRLSLIVKYNSYQQYRLLNRTKFIDVAVETSQTTLGFLHCITPCSFLLRDSCLSNLSDSHLASAFDAFDSRSTCTKSEVIFYYPSSFTTAYAIESSPAVCRAVCATRLQRVYHRPALPSSDQDRQTVKRL